MSDNRMAVREVASRFRRQFGGLLPVGNAVYKIRGWHPNGIVHAWYVFGGVPEFIEEFIPYVATYPFWQGVRNGVIDKAWIEHTLKELRKDNSMEKMIRKYLTDPDGRSDGRLCRFVVAMLRARDPEDKSASVTLADLKGQLCLKPFTGDIHEIAIEHRRRGIIAMGPENKPRYRLRVLFPLFSREWWEPFNLGW